MRITTRLKVLGIFAVAGALALSGGGPALAAPGYGPYTCTGGDIPSGTYRDLTVTGACSVPDGAVITVTGSVLVGRGAQLDAQSAPSTITVAHNVTGLAGSLVGLGCQPPAYTGNSGHQCTIDPDGHSTVTVGGSLTLIDPAAVLLNGITVNGNVTALGGGGPIPWSIKNDTVRGNVTVAGQTTDWIGLLFNHVRGNVTLFHIKITDTDPGAPGAYVVRNTVGRNLICYGVTPGISGGFIPGEVNVVGGHALGQCASLVAG
jgi:hypothetical protein